MNHSISNDLLTQKELLVLIRVSRQTLVRMKKNQTAPVGCRVGKRVFYRKEEIAAWLEAQKIVGQEDQGRRNEKAP